MQRLILAAGIGLTMIIPVANGTSSMQSDATECHEEAVSTGLEQDAAIQAYVAQCMQRFAGLEGYDETTTDGYMEPQVEERLEESEPVN